MSSALKASLTPGSIGFLALSLGLWIILRYGWPRIPRLASAWAAVVLGAYLVLSSPIVALMIAGWLPASTPLDVTKVRSIGTLIVLDGDNRVGRVREAVRIHRAFPAAQVVVLGQRWVMDALVAEGVPRSLILIDNSPGTTRAQIAWIKPRVPPEVAATTAIVASRLQMPRVAALARAAGLELLLAPSLIDDEPPAAGFGHFVPQYIALRVSRDALYELVALKYYAWKGWITKR